MYSLHKKLILLLCLVPSTFVIQQLPTTWGTPYEADSRQIHCLARNIYHESRGEPFLGKVAVAQVTLNRVLERSWGSTLCNVVFAHKQFSWTLDKTKRERDHKSWQESLTIARAMVNGSLRLPDFPALYFHTHQVFPKWRHSREQLKVIGNHIFYY